MATGEQLVLSVASAGGPQQQAKVSPNTSAIGSAIVNSPSLPLITHTASASNLVEFYCNVAETKINEDVKTLDLIRLLTNSTGANCEPHGQEAKRSGVYFKRTSEIKLEKENLLYSFNNKPVNIDETYTFELNGNTNYLNMFLWTVQFLSKGTRKRNLLLGYVSLPLNELAVDCWNTSKGETQTTCHFNPIEEFKVKAHLHNELTDKRKFAHLEFRKATAAIARLTRSHVISDHPGFEPSLTMGAITVNVQHTLLPNVTLFITNR